MNKIERTVKKLLDDNELLHPPVPVEDIARSLGANLKYAPFSGPDAISGMLYKDGETCVIGINSSHHPNRQRFSIAHEIGHLLLGHKKDVFIDKVVNFRDSRSSLAIDTEEIAANAFAAELLMPKEFIRNELKKLVDQEYMPTEQELIEEFAKVFKVSTTAMEYRLNNLGVLISH